MEINAVRLPPPATSASRAPAQAPRPPVPAPAFDESLVAARADQGWPVGPLVVEHARQAQVDVNALWFKVEQARAAYAAESDAA